MVAVEFCFYSDYCIFIQIIVFLSILLLSFLHFAKFLMGVWGWGGANLNLIPRGGFWFICRQSFITQAHLWRCHTGLQATYTPKNDYFTEKLNREDADAALF